MEKWIEGFEGLYSVTDDGVVYSHNYRRSGKKMDLVHVIQSNGMHTVCMIIDGKRRHLSVARLMAEAFILNPDNLPCICFLDGDNDNIVLSNIAWCTRSTPVKLAHERKKARGAKHELR